jgi:tetratricopeptide (TPR) repeat protein
MPSPSRSRRGALAAAVAAFAGCAHGTGSRPDEPTPEAGKACAGIAPLSVLSKEPQSENALARGQALYCLGLYAASLTVLTEEAIGKPVSVAIDDAIKLPEPPALADDRAPALRWLVYIHRRFPGWERINDTVGELTRADLDRPELADVRDDLHALAARFEYQKGRFAKAVELLRMIPASSPLHVEAVLLEGAINVRVSSPQQAIANFDEVLRVAPAGGDAKRARDRDLAAISLARIYYAMEQFEAAGRLYDSLQPSSPYWAAAALEGAWTRYKLKDHPGALARLRTLAARSSEAPVDTMAEATALEATIALQEKRPADAEKLIKRFNDVYPQLFTEAKRASFGGLGMLYAVASSVRSGSGSELPPPYEAGPPLGAGRVKLLLADPPVARRFDEIDELQREIAKCASLDAGWPPSSAGRKGCETLLSRRLAAEREASEQFRHRLLRLADALGEQIKQVIKFESEVLPSHQLEYEMVQ